MMRGSVTLCGKCGRIGGQQIQFAGPELFDEFTEPAHALGVEPVIPVSPLFAGCYQAGLLQEQQVLGHRGAADREMRGQLPDCLFMAGEKMQQPSPVRLRGNLQGIQHMQYVSDH